MTSNLQDKLNWKNGIYNDDLKNCKTNYHYLQLQHAISEVLVPIPRGEDEYQNWLAQKLSDPSASYKICWSILKWFYMGKYTNYFTPTDQ